MKKIINLVLPVLAVAGFMALVPLQVSAQESPGPAGQIKGGVTAVSEPNKTCGASGREECTLGDQIKNVVNILLYVLGAIAVVMIVIGGVRYATSNGDSSSIKGAKDTILYAVIGLVVAIMAFAIVNFVVDAFLPPKD